MANANVVTASGNEITDAIRLAQIEGDGKSWPDYSYGIYDGTTNMLQWSYFDGTQRQATPPNGIFGGADTAHGATAVPVKVTDNAFPEDKAFINEITLFKPATAGWSYCAYGIGFQPFTIGQTYTVSFWMKYVSGNAQPLQIFVEDSNGTNVVNAGIVRTPAALQFYSFTFTAGVTGNNSVLMFICNGTTDPSMTFRLGGVQVENKAIPTAYKRSSGARGIRANPSIAIPSANLKGSTSQYWWGVRLRTGWSDADTSAMGFNPQLIGWAVDANNRTYMAYLRGSKQLAVGQFNTGVQTQLGSTVLGSVSRGDSMLGICYYDGVANKLGVSINGGNFLTTNATPPNLAAQGSFYAGSGGQITSFINSQIMYAVGGIGIPTNADAATLYALGDNHPSTFNVTSAAANMTFIWPAETVGYFSKIFGGLPDKTIEPAYHLTTLEPQYHLTTVEPAYALKAIEPVYKIKSLEPQYALKSLEPAYKLTGVDIEY